MALHSPHARHDLLVEAGRHFVSAAVMPEALLATEDSAAAARANGGRLGEKESHQLVNLCGLLVQINNTL